VLLTPSQPASMHLSEHQPKPSQQTPPHMYLCGGWMVISVILTELLARPLAAGNRRAPQCARQRGYWHAPNSPYPWPEPFSLLTGTATASPLVDMPDTEAPWLELAAVDAALTAAVGPQPQRVAEHVGSLICWPAAMEMPPGLVMRKRQPADTTMPPG
jgi:hypothetical protein